MSKTIQSMFHLYLLQNRSILKYGGALPSGRSWFCYSCQLPLDRPSTRSHQKCYQVWVKNNNQIILEQLRAVLVMVREDVPPVARLAPRRGIPRRPRRSMVIWWQRPILSGSVRRRSLYPRITLLSPQVRGGGGGGLRGEADPHLHLGDYQDGQEVDDQRRADRCHL